MSVVGCRLSVVRLLDFLVNSHLLQDGVVLLELEALGSILPVLSGDVARCAWQTALLHLCAFQNHLDSVAFNFLCHNF